MMKRPSTVYIPETLPVTETVRRMQTRGKLNLTIKGEALAERIKAPGPVSAASALRPGDDFDGSTMELPLDLIVAYDRNPRKLQNPAYIELRDSIREKGFLGSLIVTKRPGTPANAPYMLYMGGGTRLKILNELYADGDSRFAQIPCRYKEWISEADTLASFLIENEYRGDTSFWEKASGHMDLAQELEREAGRSLSSRELQTALREKSMLTNQATVLLYQFAVQRLASLGEWLTRDNVSSVKRRIATLEGLAAALQLDGRFDAGYSSALQRFLSLFARQLESRQAAQLELDDRATLVLRGDLLLELLHGLDAIGCEVLGLAEPIAALLSSEIDAAGREPVAMPRLLAIANGVGALDAQCSDVRPSHTKPSSRDRYRSDLTHPHPATPPTPTQNVIANDITDEQLSAIGSNFLGALKSWAGATRVEQWLMSADSMPYLYFIELPEELLQGNTTLDEIADPDLGSLDGDLRRIRSTSYRLLALLSGQLTDTVSTKANVVGRLPAESPWRQASLADCMSPEAEAFFSLWEDRIGGLVNTRTCELAPQPTDLLTVLREPHLTALWTKMTTAYSTFGRALAAWHKDTKALGGV